ncbi:PREDICTED: putative F-box protein At3g10790 [Camelina sativa]|uniref:F-box protein At3g10790 n=1 Tax=Camelina sativa TaxID=90675 RepID=A0ABM1R144_CAMSA|nr:PREDICTED: putative F-box protein At3g10790 [Camelina sativa]
MIRLGSKAMRSNTSPPLTRSQTYPLERLPVEMKEEILMKLKIKCISKFISVSKSWSSIVRSKSLTNLYLNRSLAQPRILLFLIHRGDRDMQLFHSSSQEDPSSDHHTVSCNRYDFSPPVRGLICGLNEHNLVMIGNPTTSQFITLPRIISVRKDISCFLGYDPVTDEYKVLCMMTPRGYHHLHITSSRAVAYSQEHQVFTIGARSKRWRNIECKHIHYTLRRTQGICSNGFVYYLAWINDLRSLICFDVRYETFSVVPLPKDVQVQLLSNYGEKIAVTNLLIDSTLDLWVLEDASRQDCWSKVSIVIPSLYWNDDSFMCFQTAFRFRGTLGTGELVFAPSFVTDPYFLLCYNPKESKARKIHIEGIGAQFIPRHVYLDHVESPMILESVAH